MTRIAKLEINDVVVEYDFDSRPLLEALLIEKVTGMRYADWESELGKGSVKAITGLIWLALRRAGEKVAYRDLLPDESEECAYPVDLTKFLMSMQEFAVQLQGEKDEQQPFPTGASHPSGQAGTPTT